MLRSQAAEARMVMPDQACNDHTRAQASNGRRDDEEDDERRRDSEPGKAAGESTGTRDPAVRPSGQTADCVVGGSVQGERRQQNELVDAIAERIQLLGGVSLAMAHDVAETTLIPRPPRCHDEAPVQISRLLNAHEIVFKEARTMARLAAEHGDDGTNDLIVSDLIRSNELQVWFVAEHVVDVPLAQAV